MKTSPSFLLILLTAATLACNKGTTDAGPQPVIMKDVAYGPAPLQKMDVHLPAVRSTSTTKVIILIHGGAWNSGDKSDFDAYVDTLKKREPSYAIFNLNYRLVVNSSTTFPMQELDVKAAIDFILTKVNEYGISQKFVLIGASAGAHLAMLDAYKYNHPIKAVVDFFGPTELTVMYDQAPNPLIRQMMEEVIGGTPTTVPLLYQESSPYNYVSALSPPTLVLQGGLDPLVPPYQSNLLISELQSKSVPNQLVYYPNEGHSWVGASLTDSFNKIQSFLATYVQ